MSSRGHICGETSWCSFCQKHINRLSHNCCWSPPTEKAKEQKRKEQATFQLIVYDFETVVVENPNRINDWLPEQYPNMVGFAKVCEKCVNLPAATPCDKCVIKKQCIKYATPEDDKWAVVDQFLDYILNDPSCKDAIVLAHNGSRFDCHFVIRRILARGIIPEVTANGNQIMLMTFNLMAGQKFNNLTFKDTYLLMPLPLAALPEAFGLQNMAKGEFPYLYNMPAHYGVVVPELPAPEFYCPQSKNARRRAEFEVWYEENKSREFDFDLELERYCELDVAILRDAVVGYMETSIRLTTWNPVIHCCTYAAFSMFQVGLHTFYRWCGSNCGHEICTLACYLLHHNTTIFS